MFDQCWANVVDGGPTLVEHWVDVSCLLGKDLFQVEIIKNVLVNFFRFF